MGNRQIGNKAEDLACRYLEKLGFEVLRRNYQIRGGELDIVAMDSDELVFVEVKARYSHEYGLPIESITPWKVRALKRTAQWYVLQTGWGDKSYRIDALLTDYADSKDNPSIELVKNITF